MNNFILDEYTSVNKFKECADCLNNYKDKIIKNYVEQIFPCSQLESSGGIRKLNGSLAGKSWLEVAKLYWDKKRVAEHREDEGNKFWLVLPSGNLQQISQIILECDEDCLQLIVDRPNGSQLYLAVNFVS